MAALKFYVLSIAKMLQGHLLLPYAALDKNMMVWPVDAMIESLQNRYRMNTMHSDSSSLSIWKAIQFPAKWILDVVYARPIPSSCCSITNRGGQRRFKALCVFLMSGQAIVTTWPSCRRPCPADAEKSRVLLMWTMRSNPIPV